MTYMIAGCKTASKFIFSAIYTSGLSQQFIVQGPGPLNLGKSLPFFGKLGKFSLLSFPSPKFFLKL